MICDFCLSPDPRWTYPTAPMEIVGGPIINRSEDDFAVCEDCHRFLAAGDVIGLADRIVRWQPLHVPAGSERDGGIVVYDHESVRRGAAMANVLRFMDARRGMPTPL